MFYYKRFDFDIKKTIKFKYIFITIIISLLIYNIIININNDINNDIKDDVKIISSNSRRIISNLYNYTETMSDFIVNNDETQINEIKKIRLSIDYLKELKELEIKEKQLKELKELEIKEKQLKELEIKEKQLKELEIKEELKQKAINLVKLYIPNFNSLIKLTSEYSNIDGYVNINETYLNCFKELIEINNEELFEQLIDIDYDNYKVSFNYFDKNETYFKDTNNIISSHLYSKYDENNKFYKYSHYIYRNYKENIIRNPIYKIIKDKLEFEDYTEPNLDKYYYDEYNNKSKYFTKSLNDFNIHIENAKNNHPLIKFSSNYTNNIQSEYYKYSNNFDYYNLYLEFIKINEVIINNPNPSKIYNQNSYKNICNINSRIYNNLPYIWEDYHSFGSNYNNYDHNNRNLVAISKKYLENILNNDDNIQGKSNRGYYDSYYYDNYTYNLDKTKGSRFFKNNLTEYLPNTVDIYDMCGNYNGLHWCKVNNYNDSNNNYIIEHIQFITYYFIEKIYINFPEIIIYDEYEYIRQLSLNVADIYNLPIIPPISFM